jgi:FkbM family methyltransferase
LIDGNVRVVTPKRHEAYFQTRTSTNDGALVLGIVQQDEYRLKGLPALSGMAIDVGAHIGAVTVALALDHPNLRVIAVEVVPENVSVLRQNVLYNDLGDRVAVVEAAAAAPGTKRVSLLWDYRAAGDEPAGYVSDSRYIANLYDKTADADRHTVDAIDLDTLMDGIDRLALLKIDCEGCEWQFLRSPRVKDIDLILGEYHNGGGIEALRALIGGTHDVTQTGGAEDVGMFRAVAR